MSPPAAAVLFFGLGVLASPLVALGGGMLGSALFERHLDRAGLREWAEARR